MVQLCADRMKELLPHRLSRSVLPFPHGTSDSSVFSSSGSFSISSPSPSSHTRKELDWKSMSATALRRTLERIEIANRQEEEMRVRAIEEREREESDRKTKEKLTLLQGKFFEVRKFWRKLVNLRKDRWVKFVRTNLQYSSMSKFLRSADDKWIQSMNRSFDEKDEFNESLFRTHMSNILKNENHSFGRVMERFYQIFRSEAVPDEAAGRSVDRSTIVADLRSFIENMVEGVIHVIHSIQTEHSRQPTTEVLEEILFSTLQVDLMQLYAIELGEKDDLLERRYQRPSEHPREYGVRKAFWLNSDSLRPKGEDVVEDIMEEMKEEVDEFDPQDLEAFCRELENATDIADVPCDELLEDDLEEELSPSDGNERSKEPEFLVKRTIKESVNSYQKSIDELANFSTVPRPQEKLSCVSRVSDAIMACAREFYKEEVSMYVAASFAGAF
eukprot:TRINITY_DN258_c0_g1_i15.p1 TRINITY_DN258_c0_g1~~TRINITY_DN258_c0_g1_i15.p1  ORF type:complete len:444 (+),score=130.71 TRINITY_DN258_c0_g1_i15:455-1786(+)